MNDKAVQGLINKTGKDRFAWDSYRRFIQMFGDVAMGVPHAAFEKALEDMKAKKKLVLDSDLSAADLEALVGEYKKIVKNMQRRFPSRPT